MPAMIRPLSLFVLVLLGQFPAFATDLTLGGGPLILDWMRMTPYAASGSYQSRVFDAGQAASWGPVTWSASTPAGLRWRQMLGRSTPRSAGSRCS